MHLKTLDYVLTVLTVSYSCHVDLCQIAAVHSYVWQMTCKKQANWLLGVSQQSVVTAPWECHITGTCSNRAHVRPATLIIKTKKEKEKKKSSYKPGQCTSRSPPLSAACFSRWCQQTQAGTLVIALRALLTLTFGEPVGLADGERMAPFWMRSSLGGTGGRLRCCMQWPASPPWAFLC